MVWCERNYKYTCKKRYDIISLNINGKLTTDNKTVADSFNKYFTTVAQTLIDKLGPAAKTLEII